MGATSFHAGKYASKPLPIDPERDINQGNEYRNFHQRADNSGERSAVADTEGGDSHGDPVQGGGWSSSSARPCLTDHFSERQIGVAVFGRKPEYSPADDSIVRVQAHQLRLRIEEYFHTEGRLESTVIEIPRGSYVPIFRKGRPSSIGDASAGLAGTIPVPFSRHFGPATLWIGLVLLAALGTACVALSVQNWDLRNAAGAVRASSHPQRGDPWLLAAAFDKATLVTVVLPDGGFGTLQGILDDRLTLEDYLDPKYPDSLAALLPGDSRWLRAIGRPSTGFSEMVIAHQLGQIAEAQGWQLLFRQSRDLKMRDMAGGNFILLGSSMSNPWVGLFARELVLRSHWDVQNQVLGFRDTALDRGARTEYASTGRNGEPGAGLAVIALFDKPESGSGAVRVMILAGTNVEATEAAWNFVSAEGAGPTLPDGVIIPLVKTGEPCHVEILLETSAMAGSPGAVAVRKVSSR